ncbi:YkyB family protein [Bacillus sp. FJAT-52991]|uniref:YkyB family protein n=1 Tax=Bacillus kandeliae TaxID=3129297 RepID=A0ABZ2NA46_9BACI
MNNPNSQNESLPHSPSTVNLAQAIFTVNRHAKTAMNPKFLYSLKKKALIRMIQEGRAKKTGLHFSNNPKNSQQQSDVLVTCGAYTFHMPPCKEDFHNLPHFGRLDQKTRNPRSNMNLMEAKKILQAYTGMKEKHANPSYSKKQYKQPVFKPLGQSYY